jgi:hypothetical protein
VKKRFIVACLLLFVTCQYSLFAAEPVLWWSFDQDLDSQILDRAGSISDTIEGQYRYLPGVSGKALKTDG